MVYTPVFHYQTLIESIPERLQDTYRIVKVEDIEFCAENTKIDTMGYYAIKTVKVGIDKHILFLLIFISQSNTHSK
jgi:hypothetical protein